MTDRTKKRLWLCALVVFIALCAVITIFVGVPMIRMANDPQVFRDWVDASGIWGRFLFVGMVVLQVVIAFIPGEPVELAAGYTFGFWEGTALTLCGFVLGSWLVFALVCKFGREFVGIFFPEREIKRLGFLKDPKRAAVLAFVCMLIPGTPKDLLSYFAGLMPISCAKWLAIVAVARIPSLVTSTLSGAAAGQKNYLVSAIMLVVTLIISALGICYYRKLCKQEEKTPTD